MNIDIDFISGDHGDWEYYTKKGYENIIDVRDNFPRIPLKNLSLDLYKRWNLDKDKMLVTNFIRFKKIGTKTIGHWAVQEKYRFINELKYKVFSLKFEYRIKRILHKILFYISKVIFYPLVFFPFIKTYEIVRPIHKILYLSSRWFWTLFKLFPKTTRFEIWKKKIENLNMIALVNSKKGFGIVSKIALQYFISYYLILKELNPDMVFMYNDDWIENTSLSIACEKLDIAHYYTERSNVLDYSNFDSTAVWFDGDINKRQLPEWDSEKERKLNERIKGYLKKYELGVASLIGEEEKVKKMTHDRKFILVPLQIMDDTKNIKFSPLLENMIQLVNLVIDNCPKGYDIIIKRHPWEFYKRDTLYLKSLKKIIEIANKYDHVYICRHVDTYDLLKQCSALVTINSTMSQENLYKARAPMVLLGDTYVRGWGFTYDVNNINEFHLKLKEALDKGVTPEMEKKMKQFLYLLFFEHVVKGQYAYRTHVRDKNGKIIKSIKKPHIYSYIAERIYNELMEIKSRKAKGLKRMLPPPKKLRCMIDRSNIPNYKGVILNAKYKTYHLHTHI